MFLSLLDLMRQQAGWPLSAPVAPAPLDRVFAPAQTDWIDEGAHLVLRVPLAGMDPKSVQVHLTESSLTLAGHRTHEEQVEGAGFFRASASYGSFARTLPLPVRVIPRQSTATWLDGEVLEIRLHKA